MMIPLSFSLELCQSQSASPFTFQYVSAAGVVVFAAVKLSYHGLRVPIVPDIVCVCGLFLSNFSFCHFILSLDPFGGLSLLPHAVFVEKLSIK